jgi:hypothetical protein
MKKINLKGIKTDVLIEELSSRLNPYRGEFIVEHVVYPKYSIGDYESTCRGPRLKTYAQPIGNLHGFMMGQISKNGDLIIKSNEPTESEIIINTSNKRARMIPNDGSGIDPFMSERNFNISLSPYNYFYLGNCKEFEILSEILKPDIYFPFNEFLEILGIKKESGDNIENLDDCLVDIDLVECSQKIRDDEPLVLGVYH